MPKETNIERDARKRSLIYSPDDPRARPSRRSPMEAPVPTPPDDSTFFRPSKAPAPGDLIRVNMPDGEGNRTERMYRVDPDGTTATAVDDDREGMAVPSREFRTRPGRLKPGSLTARGGIIAPDGLECHLIGSVVLLPHIQPSGRYSAWQRAGWGIGFLDYEDGKTYVQATRVRDKIYRPGRGVAR